MAPYVVRPQRDRFITFRFLALLPAIALASCGRATSRAADSPRETTSLDLDWRFLQGEAPGAESPDYDDASWRRVRVPHDWSIEGAFARNAASRGDGGFLPSGVSWYRRSFALPAPNQYKRVLLEFDGVMANSRVYVNGRLVGERPSGYVSFQYDVTEFVQFGDNRTNVLAVRTDTSGQPASRWYTGAGIYRHVRLTLTGATHIAPWGVHVTTPDVAEGKATVDLVIEIANESASDLDIVVRTALIAPNGKESATTDSNVRLASGADRQAARQRLALQQPELWDIDSPQLYQAVTTLLVDDEPVDQVTTSFGVRDVEFRSETGFWLNGRNLKAKGVCLHHACGALGAAVPMSAWRRRLETLQEVGVNAIRTAHNPVAPEFLDLCDELGLLVMDELFDCWTVAKRPHDYHLHFREWAHRDLRDTIRRDRNHPSIVLYSVGNEIRDTPLEEHAKRILRGLVDVCHEVDPTRPVTQALFRPNVSHDYDNGLADMLDVIGTNYRDQELLQAWQDDRSRRIIGTEQHLQRSTWLLCRDSPQYAGQFLWVGIDYLGESRRWPVTTFNGGLLDRAGVPKPAALERQSWWSDRPVVHVVRRIAPDETPPVDPGYEAEEWARAQAAYPDWSPRNRTPHSEQVEVYSNCEEVELLLNGKSLGSRSLPTDAAPRTWTVPFEEGVVTAIGRNSGQVAAESEIRTAGEPAKIVLSADRYALSSDWNEVLYVEAQVVDANGVLVPTAFPHIRFAISGPAEVVAVDCGSIVNHEPFQASQRRAFQGRCFAIVRATERPGKVVVSAFSEGLTIGSMEIESLPVD